MKAYYVLKLAGDDPDTSHMARACEAILAHGGGARANVFTRSALALFGQVPWRAVPVTPHFQRRPLFTPLRSAAMWRRLRAPGSARRSMTGERQPRLSPSPKGRPARHRQGGLHERCPPKAEVVSSNLAGSAIISPSQHRWHSPGTHPDGISRRLNWLARKIGIFGRPPCSALCGPVSALAIQFVEFLLSV